LRNWESNIAETPEYEKSKKQRKKSKGSFVRIGNPLVTLKGGEVGGWAVGRISMGSDER